MIGCCKCDATAATLVNGLWFCAAHVPKGAPGPGIYHAVPFDLYHGDLCDGPSVSASTLVQLESRCPAYAFARHYLHPSPVPHEDTEATAFGTAAHCYIVEGPGVFSDRYLLKPRGMNFATKAGKAWKEEYEGRGEIITTDDFEAICAMAKAVADHTVARTMLSGGRPEVTLVAHDDETGLWLKARPDYFRGALGVNFKTAANGKREPWERQAWSLGYHISAAMSIDVMAACGIKSPLYGFVVQEKEPPYTVVARVLDDAVIGWGRIQYRAALRKFADCLASGKWPGYSDDVETVGLPKWAERGLQDRSDAGEFSTLPASNWNPENMLAG